jgi:hypothetical protein
LGIDGREDVHRHIPMYIYSGLGIFVISQKFDIRIKSCTNVSSGSLEVAFREFAFPVEFIAEGVRPEK